MQAKLLISWTGSAWGAGLVLAEAKVVWAREFASPMIVPEFHPVWKI